ncbi:lysine--tRNA ligase [Candidatus Marinamargulisbacteria bacterium SCGC AG-410-N11]|nr:lysine--tRNA ligase [Candidatus Marinamargulisbacteria bacterium SCGC AG-410-N11]
MSDTDTSTKIIDTHSEEEIRINKINSLREKNVDPFINTFDRSHSIDYILKKYETITNEDQIDTTYTIGGRLIAKRGHGKAMFCNLSDDSGSIQIYINNKLVSNEDFETLSMIDVGDIVGINGSPFRTKRGELSIKVKKITLLTKSILPLPEKYHGLKDKELRYRKRYLDLISNPEIKNVFKQRSIIIRELRNFLDTKDFLEVETPVLHNIYGGANAKPFLTHHNSLNQDLYLRIALELHLKRLIVGGFEKIYEIGRVFRNEGFSYKHNPEYTLLELYWAFSDYNGVMKLTEDLLAHLTYFINKSYKIKYKDIDIDFTPPFKRLTLSDALKQYADVSIDNFDDLKNKATELGIQFNQKPTRGYLINEIYDKLVEPNLISPTFIIDYPWETSPLAKKKPNNPQFVERFELIINGMEIANAFSELNDPIDQKSRFVEQQKEKEAGWDDAHEIDEDFIESLKYGMPPTGGLGIGIDRVVMLLTNSHSIRDVLFFPHMRT